jgi:hypothetical protein
MQMLSRIREAFQVNLPIATVFKKPTVAELAGEIADALPGEQHRALAAILRELKDLTAEDTRQLLETESEDTRPAK